MLLGHLFAVFYKNEMLPRATYLVCIFHYGHVSALFQGFCVKFIWNFSCIGYEVMSGPHPFRMLFLCFNTFTEDCVPNIQLQGQDRHLFMAVNSVLENRNASSPQESAAA